VFECNREYYTMMTLWPTWGGGGECCVMVKKSVNNQLKMAFCFHCNGTYADCHRSRSGAYTIQSRQCTCNVIFRRIRATVVTLENQ